MRVFQTILKPQSDFYTKLGVDCVRAGCSVDLFLFPIAHVDMATLAEVPRVTGGEVHLYNNFQVLLYFCDCRNIIEISRILLFCTILVAISNTY